MFSSVLLLAGCATSRGNIEKFIIDEDFSAWFIYDDPSCSPIIVYKPGFVFIDLNGDWKYDEYIWIHRHFLFFSRVERRKIPSGNPNMGYPLYTQRAQLLKNSFGVFISKLEAMYIQYSLEDNSKQKGELSRVLSSKVYSKAKSEMMERIAERKMVEIPLKTISEDFFIDICGGKKSLEEAFFYWCPTGRIIFDYSINELTPTVRMYQFTDGALFCIGIVCDSNDDGVLDQATAFLTDKSSFNLNLPTLEEEKKVMSKEKFKQYLLGKYGKWAIEEFMVLP